MFSVLLDQHEKSTYKLVLPVCFFFSFSFFEKNPVCFTIEAIERKEQGGLFSFCTPYNNELKRLPTWVCLSRPMFVPEVIFTELSQLNMHNVGAKLFWEQFLFWPMDD